MKSIINKATYWLIFLGMIMPWGFGFGVSTAEARQLHTTATLIAEHQSIQPGVPFWVGLHMQMEPGWKTYWENPGEAGLPTEIKWELPEGFTVDALQWPKPEVVMLEGIVGYGYKGEALLLARVTPPENLSLTSEVTLKGHVQWLECDELCIPGSADVALTLPVSITEPAANSANSALFAKTREQLPHHSNIWVPLVYIDGTNMLIWMKPKSGVPIHIPDPKSVYFYSLDRGVTELGLEQKVELYGDGLLLKVPLNPNATEPVDAMVGVLYSPDGWNGERTVTSIEVRAHIQGGALPVAKTSAVAANAGTPWDVIVAIASAFLGGLILNLMPCVFPVLGLKVLSFVSHAKEDKWVLRMHGVVFAAGVVISFWCLSGLLLILREMGQGLGWGFQLQTPGFVAFLIILLFVMGLNFAGVFEIGQSVMGVGSKLTQKQGYGGSFFSGVLATIVATPCAAPFMGSAIPFALGQPPLIALIIFTSMGLGMSAPYVVLTNAPSLMKWLPRPGAWMETFKVFMAFPLWATVIWFLWVFVLQTDPNALLELMFALLAIAFGCWVYGRWSAPHKEKKTRIMGYATAGVCAVVALVLAIRAQTDISSVTTYGSNGAMNATAQEMAWLAYSDDVVNELRGKGQAVYVDFTAAWCLTCQANKKVVFGSEEVRDTFKERNIATVRADWTKRDPRITAALEKFGRTGVPLNVIYPADPNAEPIILPATLTPGTVLEAIDTMHPKEKQ